MPLRRFADETFARNGGRGFRRNGENGYAALGGNTIRFNLDSANRIIATGIAGTDAALGSGVAAGTVLRTSREAAMTIRNPRTGDTLTLDLNDPGDPVRRLAEGDPVSKLVAIGFDYSVKEAEIRDWLGNAFTPYPALAGALDGLLKGTGLRNLVFIDVAAFNYEAQPGATSPRARGRCSARPSRQPAIAHPLRPRRPSSPPGGREDLRVLGRHVGLLGEWHSHPDGVAARPSADDEGVYAYLRCNVGPTGRPYLMCICERDQTSLRAGWDAGQVADGSLPHAP